MPYSEGTFLARAASLALRRPGPAPSLHPVVQSALAEALRASAIAGLGVAWLPHSLVTDDLRRGDLVRAGSAEFDVVLQTCLYGEKSAVEGRLRRLWQAARALADAGPTPPG
jgi:LysR family transcriptional regulator, hypochlorite-specific transcription factor HypT